MEIALGLRFVSSGSCIAQRLSHFIDSMWAPIPVLPLKTLPSRPQSWTMNELESLSHKNPESQDSSVPEFTTMCLDDVGDQGQCLIKVEDYQLDLRSALPSNPSLGRNNIDTAKLTPVIVVGYFRDSRGICIPPR